MLDDLFKILVAGQQQGPEKQDNPLGDLLKVVLGGQSGAGAAPEEESAPTNGQSSGGLTDILQVILGGQGQAEGAKEGEQEQEQSAAATNPLLAPIARLLAEKLHIAPEIAQMVVMLALTLVLSQLQKDGATPEQVKVPSRQSLVQSGAARQLAQQTGMKQKDAAATLQQTISLLTGQPAQPTRAVRGGKGAKPGKPAKTNKPRPTTHEPNPTTATGRGRAKPKR